MLKICRGFSNIFDYYSSQFNIYKCILDKYNYKNIK